MAALWCPSKQNTCGTREAPPGGAPTNAFRQPTGTTTQHPARHLPPGRQHLRPATRNSSMRDRQRPEPDWTAVAE